MKKAFVCKMVTKKKHLHVMDETFTHGRLIIPMYVIYKVHTHISSVFFNKPKSSVHNLDHFK